MEFRVNHTPNSNMTVLDGMESIVMEISSTVDIRFVIATKQRGNRLENLENPDENKKIPGCPYWGIVLTLRT